MKTSLILSEGRQELILEPETEEEGRALAFLTVVREPRFMIVPYISNMMHGTNGQSLLVTRTHYQNDLLRAVTIRINPMPAQKPTLNECHVPLVLACMRLEHRRRNPVLGSVLKRKDLQGMSVEDAAVAISAEIVAISEQATSIEEVVALSTQFGVGEDVIKRQLNIQ